MIALSTLLNTLERTMPTDALFGLHGSCLTHSWSDLRSLACLTVGLMEDSASDEELHLVPTILFRKTMEAMVNIDQTLPSTFTARCSVK